LKKKKRDVENIIKRILKGKEKFEKNTITTIKNPKEKKMIFGENKK